MGAARAWEVVAKVGKAAARAAVVWAWEVALVMVLVMVRVVAKLADRAAGLRGAEKPVAAVADGQARWGAGETVAVTQVAATRAAATWVTAAAELAAEPMAVAAV